MRKIGASVEEMLRFVRVQRKDSVAPTSNQQTNTRIGHSHGVGRCTTN